MEYIIFIILLAMAIQDYLYYEVSNILFLPMLLYIKINIIVLVFFLILLLIFKHIEQYIGGADIKLILIFFSIFNFYNVIYWLLFSSIIALITTVIKKTKYIRMFPCFLIAYLGMLLL